jgi:hypothetical protein
MATWTKTTKDSATWTKASDHSATWGKTSKDIGALSFLLLENGSYILQENSGKFVLEQGNAPGLTWTKTNHS